MYGYTSSNTKVVASEAKVIREARNRIFLGESMRSIADDLNRRGVKTASGKAWGITTFSG